MRIELLATILLILAIGFLVITALCFVAIVQYAYACIYISIKYLPFLIMWIVLAIISLILTCIFISQLLKLFEKT